MQLAKQEGDLAQHSAEQHNIINWQSVAGSDISIACLLCLSIYGPTQEVLVISRVEVTRSVCLHAMPTIPMVLYKIYDIRHTI